MTSAVNFYFVFHKYFIAAVKNINVRGISKGSAVMMVVKRRWLRQDMIDMKWEQKK
jgi:hypothetical protein